MIWKRCSLCGARIPTGTRCTCKRSAHNDQRLDGIRKAYHSYRWQRAREEALNRYNHVDLYALYHDGKIVQADSVHHIVPVLDNEKLFFIASNHFPCSAASHAEIHRRYKEEGAEKVQEELRRYLSKYRAERIVEESWC